MAVAFQPGQEVGRGDLDIFLTNALEVPTNAADITYAVYYVDPGPPETEVLIGAADRAPVNPAVGEYYAALLVPTSANIGTYRIRWTFREFVNSPGLQVVQEFAVVSTTTQVTSPYSSDEQEMINSLRVLLRDNCIGGEETVELDVDGEKMVVSLHDLWEALHDLNPPSGDGICLRSAFQRRTLQIQSLSPGGQRCWKPVLHVSRAEVGGESIVEITTRQGASVTTGGHRVFLTPTCKVEAEQLRAGTLTAGEQVLSVQPQPPRAYMYDLTAADWHNFFLFRSGLVVSNSPDRNYHFRPPEHEADIGAYNRIFGYIWEDAELSLYLRRALDWWDMFPPRTTSGSLERLVRENPTWRTAIYYAGMAFALNALAINWVSEEFSLDGCSVVRVYLPTGEAVDLPISELHQVLYGDAE